MLEPIESIKVPKSHVDFANAVSAIAEQYGITEFDMEYRPHLSEGEIWDNRVRNNAIIRFRAKDGRGRPCKCLQINFEAHLTHVIEENQPSSN